MVSEVMVRLRAAMPIAEFTNLLSDLLLIAQPTR